jgi:5-methylcytosine-specific restriction endonuclease McrA
MARVEKTRAGGKWTEARYWSFIRSLLRKGFMTYPVKHHVLGQAKYAVEGERHRFEYTCASCNGGFTAKEVQVDHIKPCGSLTKSTDLEGFVSRLFCESDDLQVLCKTCHQKKTNDERSRRSK